jgi:hypothetical protein
MLFPCAVKAQEIYSPERIKGIPDSALFADLRLKIETADCPNWNRCKVRATGTHKGQRVGVEIQIREVEAVRRFLRISYISVGAPSDQLLRAIAELYHLPLTRPLFSNNAIAILEPLEASKDKLDAKIFFYADGPESRYAELYTNIDLRQGILWIKEKDEEYRKNVLRALSQ